MLFGVLTAIVILAIILFANLVKIYSGRLFRPLFPFQGGTMTTNQQTQKTLALKIVASAKDVRTQQKNYFRMREGFRKNKFPPESDVQTQLIVARNAERELDELLAEWDTRNEPKQSVLFGGVE